MIDFFAVFFDISDVSSKSSSSFSIVVGMAPGIVLDRNADFGSVRTVRVGIKAQLFFIILPKTRIFKVR